MKRQFTLIELLIVISLITILAALLLPALNKARARSRAIRCVNNQKQYVASLTQYQFDYRDWLPISQIRDSVIYSLGGVDYTWLRHAGFIHYLKYQNINQDSFCPLLRETYSEVINSVGKAAETSFGLFEWGRAKISLDGSSLKKYVDGLAYAVGPNNQNTACWTRFSGDKMSPSARVIIGDASSLMTGQYKVYCRVNAFSSGSSDLDTGVLFAAHVAGKVNVGFRDGHVESAGGKSLLAAGVRRFVDSGLNVYRLQ